MDPQLSANLLNRWEDLTGRLNAVADYLPALMLRVVLGLHFHFLGKARLAGDGENTLLAVSGWLPVTLAGWIELAGGLLLIAGLATRVVALALLVCVLSAMGGSVDLALLLDTLRHGNALPVLAAAALSTLLFSGGGRLSLDYLIGLPVGADPAPRAIADWGAFGLAALLLGAPLCLVSTAAGASLLVAGLALVGFQRWIVG